MKHNNYELEEKYKLFRTVKELLHPTISKKNISDYKIILNEELLLVRVFYPRKVSKLDRIILYIRGEGDITNCDEMYSDILQMLAKELDYMIISIDYDNSGLSKILSNVYKTINYIYNSLLKEKIDKKNIILMGDSTGANILLNIYKNLLEDKADIKKMVLFYPVLSGEYSGKTNYPSIKENTSVNYDLIDKLNDYYKDEKKDIFPLANKEVIKYPKTLLLTGNVDPLFDEAKAFAEAYKNIELKIVDFAYHGFLNTKDKEITKEYLNYLIDFVNN